MTWIICFELAHQIFAHQVILVHRSVPDLWIMLLVRLLKELVTTIQIALSYGWHVLELEVCYVSFVLALESLVCEIGSLAGIKRVFLALNFISLRKGSFILVRVPLALKIRRDFQARLAARLLLRIRYECIFLSLR